MTHSITPAETYRRISSGEAATLLDVRTPREYATLHAVGARLLPLDELNAAALVRGQEQGGARRFYLLCKSGKRARMAAEKLEAEGCSQAMVVEGGTEAWVAAGLPCESTGRGVISLERQVRIAAGALVLIGIVLGGFVHPGFVWLSAFVGAGLIFAGITDFCGMGILLARMPWNRAK
ncbi:MAG: rhodanese-like domain-containing protein [Chthoniobacter sp.]|nr:rhodanese-like domain-containing protein [Chthoniobacter sp.]